MLRRSMSVASLQTSTGPLSPRSLLLANNLASSAALPQAPTPAVAQLLVDLADNQRSTDHSKLTANLRHAYPKLGLAQRRGLLLHCATTLGPDSNAARAAVRNFTEADKAATIAAESDSPSTNAPVSATAVMQLRAALAPKHETLFAAVAREDGLSLLLQLRCDLLNFMANLPLEKPPSTASATGMTSEVQALMPSSSVSSASLSAMDGSLKQLLLAQFAPGQLELRRITYENSGGGVLEKIARYEAVHKVRGLSDLKARLGRGRRCYALFHPRAPNEPLVFVHVALLPKIATCMHYIHQHSGYEGLEDSHEHDSRSSSSNAIRDSSWGGLDDSSGGKTGSSGGARSGSSLDEDEERERVARAAIFYSINSTQPGLRGIELGNSLIKRVAAALRGDLAHLEHFCTLSPMPGFTKWLNRALTTQMAKASTPPSPPPSETSAETQPHSVSSPASSSVAVGGDAEPPLLSSEDLAMVVRIRTEHLRRQHRYDDNHHCDDNVDDGRNSSDLSHTAVLIDDCSSSSSSSVEDASSAESTSRSSQVAGYAALQQLLAPGEGWFHDPLTRENLRPLLTQLAARYLVAEKQSPRRGNSNQKPPFALDPVANFHLRNGALLHGVNFAGDASAKGLQDSATCMANYLYELPQVPSRAEAYAATGIVPCSSSVREVLDN